MLYAKLVLMAVFWSGVFPAVSIVLQTMGLFTSVFLRFACAALILLALLLARLGRFPRLTPRESVLVEASRAALIVPTNPAFTALFAAVLLRERLGKARALTIRPRRS
jgi:drug/metabolite transporter (DMT)-like permease